MPADKKPAEKTKPEKITKKAKPAKDPAQAPAQKTGSEKVKKGSNRSLVLAFINACTKDTAVDFEAICKATKLATSSVSPMLTELFKGGLVDRVEGKPLRFFRKAEQSKPGENQVMCKARGRIIPIDQCKPNDASPVCRKCDNIEH